MLRRVLFAVALLCLLPMVTFAAPSSTPSVDLINESGRLRMLAERMGKAYAQLALNVMPDKAQDQLAQSRRRFEDNLAILGRASTTPETKEAFEAVSSAYRSYASLLAAPPNKANVPAAHRLTERVVAEADRLTTAFDAQARVSTAKIVNISGRQRMLAQRMARLYFVAKLTGEQADLEKYRAEFTKALAILETAPLSNADIRRELELAKIQWLFLDQALQGIGDASSNIKNVATTSERLLETMDNLTSLYSTALKSMIGLMVPTHRINASMA